MLELLTHAADIERFGARYLLLFVRHFVRRARRSGQVGDLQILVAHLNRLPVVKRKD